MLGDSRHAHSPTALTLHFQRQIEYVFAVGVAFWAGEVQVCNDARETVGNVRSQVSGACGCELLRR